MDKQVKINMKRSIKISLAIAGMDQGDLAVKSKVSPSHISIISSKNICTLATLQKLADGLEIRPSELLARGEV